jgi:hypothetical protein
VGRPVRRGERGKILLYSTEKSVSYTAIIWRPASLAMAMSRSTGRRFIDCSPMCPFSSRLLLFLVAQQLVLRHGP